MRYLQSAEHGLCDLHGGIHAHNLATLSVDLHIFFQIASFQMLHHKISCTIFFKEIVYMDDIRMIVKLGQIARFVQERLLPLFKIPLILSIVDTRCFFTAESAQVHCWIILLHRDHPIQGFIPCLVNNAKSAKANHGADSIFSSQQHTGAEMVFLFRRRSAYKPAMRANLKLLVINLHAVQAAYH